MTRDVFAVVPARGGSKGIPRKNVVDVGGKPLLVWTVDAARAAACVDRVVVSTDDEDIAAVARAAGADVPFLRPAALSRDDTAGSAPLLHAVETLAPTSTWCCLLQPTSPLRTFHDIDAARALADARGADAVISVTPVRHHLAWQRRVDDGGWLAPLSAVATPSTRQELAPAFVPNGAIYLVKTAVLLAERTLAPAMTAALVMPGSRSVDVDVADDLVIVEALLAASSPSSSSFGARRAR